MCLKHVVSEENREHERPHRASVPRARTLKEINTPENVTHARCVVTSIRSRILGSVIHKFYDKNWTIFGRVTERWLDVLFCSYNSLKMRQHCIMHEHPQCSNLSTANPSQLLLSCAQITATSTPSLHTAAASAGLHGTGRCVHTAART